MPQELFRFLAVRRVSANYFQLVGLNTSRGILHIPGLWYMKPQLTRLYFRTRTFPMHAVPALPHSAVQTRSRTTLRAINIDDRISDLFAPCAANY